MPVLARLDFSTLGPFSPHIYAGPYFAFELNAETEPSSDLPFEEVTRNKDYGLTFGIGSDFNRVNIGVRYSVGIKKVLENEEERNQVFSIVFGFGF